MKVINVAVGILFNAENAILVSFRQATQYLEACWEFPGGKIEENETIFAALKRELKEEVGIEVTKAKEWLTYEYTYVDKVVKLNVWQVDEYFGEPSGCEGQAIQWVNKDKLTTLKFLPGNKIILDAINKNFELVLNS